MKRAFQESDLPDVVRGFPCEAGARVFLSGDLGAGKTTLVRAWLEAWDAKPRFQGSPTFPFHFQYRCGETPVDHFDFYRIEREQEIETLGLLETLMDPRRMAFVEWPERLGGLKVPGARWIRLWVGGETHWIEEAGNR